MYKNRRKAFKERRGKDFLNSFAKYKGKKGRDRNEKFQANFNSDNFYNINCTRSIFYNFAF